jgi:hypothetical protein
LLTSQPSRLQNPEDSFCYQPHHRMELRDVTMRILSS